jgi:hypothetical protein
MRVETARLMAGLDKAFPLPKDDAFLFLNAGRMAPNLAKKLSGDRA